MKIIKKNEENGDIIEMSFEGSYYIGEFPNTLKKLYIKSDRMGTSSSRTLPEFPESLEEISILNSEFYKLPKFPKHLKKLCIDGLKEAYDTLIYEFSDDLEELTISKHYSYINIPYFPPNLKKLNISDIKLYSFPELPKGLDVLECSKVYIKRSCSFNIDKLASLPELPQGLTKLVCQYNNLTSFPKLPQGLQTLNCYNNNLKRLPELPRDLQVLDCCFNKITVLPKLPHGLQYLICRNNKLTALPELPQGLQSLSISDNKLTMLPELPQGLLILGCSDNKLAALPELPKSLTTLNCCNNKITSLAFVLGLKNMDGVHFGNNNKKNSFYIPSIIQKYRQILNSYKQIQTVYNDEDFYCHTIHKTIRKSILFLIDKEPIIKNTIGLIEYVIKDSILDKVCLLEFIINKEEHSVIGMTFEEILYYVLTRIEEHPKGSEIKNVLNTKMNSAKNMCLNGKIINLINCLEGFYDDVGIQISDTDIKDTNKELLMKLGYPEMIK